jgi:hypothetical protein
MILPAIQFLSRTARSSQFSFGVGDIVRIYNKKLAKADRLEILTGISLKSIFVKNEDLLRESFPDYTITKLVRCKHEKYVFTKRE